MKRMNAVTLILIATVSALTIQACAYKGRKNKPAPKTDTTTQPTLDADAEAKKKAELERQRLEKEKQEQEKALSIQANSPKLIGPWTIDPLPTDGPVVTLEVADKLFTRRTTVTVKTTVEGQEKSTSCGMTETFVPSKVVAPSNAAGGELTLGLTQIKCDGECDKVKEKLDCKESQDGKIDGQVITETAEFTLAADDKELTYTIMDNGTRAKTENFKRNAATGTEIK